jgi:hypothetical protein
MIIKKDRTYEANSMYPNSNWYANESNYVIDETTEKGQKMAKAYIENYPFVDFEHDGEFVTKVIVLDKPEIPPEVEGKRIELVQNENGEWEYVYVDIPPTKEELLQIQLAQNTAETIEIMTTLHELQKIEQAQANAELIELTMMMGGM